MNNQYKYSGDDRYVGAPVGKQQLTNAINDTSNSKIRDGVTGVEAHVSEVHSLISALEARLETVLFPVPPQVNPVGEKTGPSGPPVSHLYDRVLSLHNTLGTVQERLRHLLSRIEL